MSYRFELLRRCPPPSSDTPLTLAGLNPMPLFSFHLLTCTIVCNHTIVTVCAIYLIYTYQNTCRLAPITVFHNAVQLVLHKILQPFNHQRCCGRPALGQCPNTRSVSDGRLTRGDVDNDQSLEMLWSASTRTVLEHSECVGRAFDKQTLTTTSKRQHRHSASITASSPMDSSC